MGRGEKGGEKMEKEGSEGRGEEGEKERRGWIERKKRDRERKMKTGRN